MENTKKNIVIIGAGPAGLSAAYSLAKEGYNIQVFEAKDYVGGMSRSFDLWGQRVDVGPHRFFSKEKRINAFFMELVGDDYTLVNRITRIYYKNSFFNYPLKIFNVLKNLPFTTVIKIMWDYFLQKLKPIQNPKTFEEWVTNRFGKKLFETFFKHYSEKLWGIPCSKIDADWAAQRIKSLSLVAAVKNAIFADKTQKHKTLVDQFAYPNYGTGTLYKRAANFVTEKGGSIHLNTPIEKVLVDKTNKTTGVVLKNGEKIQADYIISTMPLTYLVKGFENVPSEVIKATETLYFRNTILVYLEVDSIDLFDDNWIYVHSPEVKHGRITNFRNWSPTLHGDTKTSILCMEFWCFDEDEIWQWENKKIEDLGKEEIRQLDLIPNDVNILNSHTVRVPKCYPVYETGYMQHLNKITNYLNQIDNLLPIGRYGAFKYNNQDHSILMGLLAAEKIAGNSTVNLWDINTDIEYQEEGKIKDVLTA